MKRRMLLEPEILERLGGVSTITVRRAEEREEFPRRVRFSANRVGWLSDQINRWFAEIAAGRSRREATRLAIAAPTSEGNEAA